MHTKRTIADRMPGRGSHSPTASALAGFALSRVGSACLWGQPSAAETLSSCSFLHCWQCGTRKSQTSEDAYRVKGVRGSTGRFVRSRLPNFSVE